MEPRYCSVAVTGGRTVKLVSCRKDFYSADEPGPLSQSRDSGVMVFTDPTPIEGELLLVHGYNARFENVRGAYLACRDRIEEATFFPPKTVGFLWSGLGDSFLDAIHFHGAQARADAAAPMLAEYLRKGPPISILTHSLGARVALEAIKQAGVQVSRLYLTGPAVDNEHLRTKYQGSVALCEEVHVFWSKHDPVLGAAYTLDQFDHALGSTGPDQPQFKVISHDRSDFVHDHGDYRHDPVLWRTIARL